MSTVSVIIPAFNAEEHLSGAVSSVLAQSYTDIEILLVDDGSTDGTGALADTLAKTDRRIRVIHNETNKLRSGALNAGIREAHGAFISILDADDTYLPEKIEKQVAYLETHPGTAAIYGDVLILREGGTEPELFEAMPTPHGALERMHAVIGAERPSVFNGGFIPSCSALIRKEVFEHVHFDETMRNMEDLDLWLQIVGANFFMERMPLITYTYRRHPNQKSREPERMRAARAIIDQKLRAGTYLLKEELKGSRV